MTNINLLAKNGNVYTLDIKLNPTLLGRRGSHGKIATRLRGDFSGTLVLQSSVKSRKLSRRGYHALPQRELRNICNSIRERWMYSARLFNHSSNQDPESP